MERDWIPNVVKTHGDARTRTLSPDVSMFSPSTREGEAARSGKTTEMNIMPKIELNNLYQWLMVWIENSVHFDHTTCRYVFHLMLRYIMIYSYYIILYSIPWWLCIWKATPSTQHSLLMCFDSVRTPQPKMHMQANVLLRLRSFGFVVRDTALLKVTWPHREDFLGSGSMKMRSG